MRGSVCPKPAITERGELEKEDGEGKRGKWEDKGLRGRIVTYLHLSAPAGGKDKSGEHME